MPHHGELAPRPRLTLVPGWGGQGLRKLLSEFGLPARGFGAPRAAGVDAALAWAAQPGNAGITLADAEYPRGLGEIADPRRCSTSAAGARSSRRAASRSSAAAARPRQGSRMQKASRALSPSRLAVVSGLALGIEAAAQRGALDGQGSTVAVLGTGLDVTYPARNADRFAAIASRGAIVSEFPLGTPPVAAHFPRRNRIIRSLAPGVLVVEAALDSGSLITARLAGEQGRAVLAVPGAIHSPLSKGCHALIKQGAKLAERARDVLEALAGIASATTASREVPEETHALLRHMGHDPCNVDTLCGRSGLTADAVSAMLLQLELDGKVASLPGGRYQRIARHDDD